MSITFIHPVDGDDHIGTRDVLEFRILTSDISSLMSMVGGVPAISSGAFVLGFDGGASSVIDEGDNSYLVHIDKVAGYGSYDLVEWKIESGDNAEQIANFRIVDITDPEITDMSPVGNNVNPLTPITVKFADNESGLSSSVIRVNGDVAYDSASGFSAGYWGNVDGEGVVTLDFVRQANTQYLITAEASDNG